MRNLLLWTLNVKKGHLRPKKGSGYLGTIFKKQKKKKKTWTLAAISAQGPLVQTVLHREDHALALPASALLDCLPALFLPSKQVLIKEFLESYYNQQNWGFPPHPIGAVQLWPIRAALFWPIKSQGRELLAILSQLASSPPDPGSQRAPWKDGALPFPGWSWNTEDVSPVQSAVFIAMLYYSQAALSKIPFFAAPQTGDSCWHLNWHQRPWVHTLCDLLKRFQLIL